MSQVVVDASVALAWCFPDEGSDYADDVLVALEERTILIPAVWTLETANALLVGDASYLELSIRHSASLATLDGRMKKAALKAGVAIFNDGIKSK